MTHTTNTITAHHVTTSPSSSGRFRQAVGFGAGIVATLTAGIVFAAAGASAGPGADEATFVPITPCRLFDTRPAPDNVGERATPLGANDIHIQQVTGTNGNCVIPTDATAVALNATAVGATAPSFGTFYPADAPLPDSSNLNYGPGQAATPNKVDVKLSADGKVAVFNKFGSVNMLADITGYYTNTGLQQLDAQLAEVTAKADEALELAQLESMMVTNDDIPLTLGVLGAVQNVASLTIEGGELPGGARQASVHYSINVGTNNATNNVECGISTGDELQQPFVQNWEPGAIQDGSPAGSLSGHRIVHVDSEASKSVNLLCRNEGNGFMVLDNAVMTADISYLD